MRKCSSSCTGAAAHWLVAFVPTATTESANGARHDHHPPARRDRGPADASDAFGHVLDSDTDTRIASAIDRSISAVGQRRRGLGIARSQLAALEGRHWTPKEDALLGTMSDREVGREIRVSKASVERRRVALGIDAFVTGRRRELSTLAGAKYFEEYQAGAGVADIARKHGISSTSVRKALNRYQHRLADESRRTSRARRKQRRRQT